MAQSITHPAPNTSWPAFLRSAHRSSLALVCLAVWLHAADSLIIATMMPAILADLGGAHLVAWSFTLYLVASITSGAASALLTLRYGLRLPMSLAAALFALGCLLSALAPSMPVMLLGRLLQGFGGGALVSFGFIAARQLFPAHFIPKAMASVSTAWGASAFIGPLLGGGFVEYATWRWGFVAFAAQALALSLWIALQKTDGTPAEHPAEAPIFPWQRLLLLSLSVLLVAASGLTSSPLSLTLCLLLGSLSFLLFLHRDASSTRSRMFPRQAFSLRTRNGAIMLLLLCFTMATVANEIYGALLMVKLHALSPLQAGYIIACGAIGWSLSAFATSNSPASRDGQMITLGFAMITVSILGFVLAFPTGPVWLLTAIALLEGAGFGIAISFILRYATAFAEPEEIPRITSGISTAQRIGYAFGGAYIGLIGNLLGFDTDMSLPEAASFSRLLFLSCLPLAAIGLIALHRIQRPYSVSRKR